MFSYDSLTGFSPPRSCSPRKCAKCEAEAVAAFALAVKRYLLSDEGIQASQKGEQQASYVLPVGPGFDPDARCPSFVTCGFRNVRCKDGVQLQWWCTCDQWGKVRQSVLCSQDHLQWTVADLVKAYPSEPGCLHSKAIIKVRLLYSCPDSHAGCSKTGKKDSKLDGQP
jgi:hypothetical protein